jgi:hypothetical protein
MQWVTMVLFVVILSQNYWYLFKVIWMMQEDKELSIILPNCFVSQTSWRHIVNFSSNRGNLGFVREFWHGSKMLNLQNHKYSFYCETKGPVRYKYQTSILEVHQLTKVIHKTYFLYNYRDHIAECFVSRITYPYKCTHGKTYSDTYVIWACD